MGKMEGEAPQMRMLAVQLGHAEGEVSDTGQTAKHWVSAGKNVLGKYILDLKPHCKLCVFVIRQEDCLPVFTHREKVRA